MSATTEFICAFAFLICITWTVLGVMHQYFLRQDKRRELEWEKEEEEWAREMRAIGNMTAVVRASGIDFEKAAEAVFQTALRKASGVASAPTLSPEDEILFECRRIRRRAPLTRLQVAVGAVSRGLLLIWIWFRAAVKTAWQIVRTR